MSSSEASDKDVALTSDVAPNLKMPQLVIFAKFFMCELCGQLKDFQEETQEQHLASRTHINAELLWIQNALEGPKDLDQGTERGEHEKSAYEERLSKEGSKRACKDADQQDRVVVHANPDLDNSLICVMKHFGLSAEDLRLRKKVFDHIKMFLAHILRGSDGRLRLFGSSFTRAGLKDSGLDICFENCSPHCMISALQWVKGSGNFVDMKDNLHSSPPRFSFTDKKSGIQCTISCDTEKSVRSSEYVEELLALDQRALILAQCFRYWARVCQIDKADEGAMKGYCFTLMVISYLQTQLVLPSKQASFSSWKSSNTKSIGELWLGLLRFYKRRFCKEDVYVNIRADMPSDKGWKKSVLIVIEDPCADWNVAHPPVKRKVFNYMKECFKKSLQYFSVKQPSNEGVVQTGAPSDASTSRSSSRRQGKSESDMDLESIGSDNGGRESEDDDSGEEDIVSFHGDDTDDRHDDVDYALLDSDASSSEGDGQEIGTKDATSSDDQHTRKGSRPKSGSLEDDARLESNDYDDDRHILCTNATGNGPDVRPRRTSSNSDSQVFRFTKVELCGKIKRPFQCIECKRSTHFAKDCPDKKVDLQELLQLTDGHSRLLETLCGKILSSCEPLPEEVQSRKNELRRLERYIKDSFKDAKLYLFGSSNNGFGFRNSDMDICMMLGSLRSEQIDHLHYITELNKHLKKCQFVSKVHAIKTAKVPIVKFVFSNPEIEADISLYNNLALENTELLLSYGRIDERVRLLGYALKYFAKACEIGDASRGTISSYAYILMLIHYLQNRKPPVLPVLQQLYLPNEKRRIMMVDGWDVSFFKNIAELPKVWDDFGRNQESVGELWLGFFRYYVEEFDFKRDVITIRQRNRLTKFEKGWNRYTMAIEDPFKRDHNLGAGINEKVFHYIFKIFANARNLYGMPVSIINADVVGYFYDITYLKRDLDMPQDRLCNICGKIGHSKKNCPQKQDKSFQLRQCSACKEVGHVAKHCPKKRKGKRELTDQACLKCGIVGHFKKNCPENKNVSQKPSEDVQNTKATKQKFQGSESVESSKNGATKPLKDSAAIASHEEDRSYKMQSASKVKSRNEETKTEGEGDQKKKPKYVQKQNSNSSEDNDASINQLVSLIDQLKMIVNDPKVAIRIGELNEDLAALQSKITPTDQSKQEKEKKATEPKKKTGHSKERVDKVSSMANLGESTKVDEAVVASAFVSPQVPQRKASKTKRGQNGSKEPQGKDVLINFEETSETSQRGSAQRGKPMKEKNAVAKKGTVKKDQQQTSDASLLDSEGNEKKQPNAKRNFKKKQRNKAGNSASAKREQSSATSSSDSDSPYESDDEKSLVNVHGGAIRRAPAEEQDQQHGDGKAGKKSRRNRRERRRQKEKNKKSAEQDLDVKTAEENADIPGRRRNTSATTLSHDDSAIETKRVVKTNLGASKGNREFLSLFTLGPSINFAKGTDLGGASGSGRPNRAMSESRSETDDSVYSGNVFRGSGQRGRGGHRGRGDNKGRGDLRNRGSHSRGDSRGRGSNRGRVDQGRGTPNRVEQGRTNERERSYSTGDTFLDDYGFQHLDDGATHGGGRGQRGHRGRGRSSGRMRGRSKGGH